MALKFNCSYCGNEIYVHNLKVGEMALCRNCDRKVEIPVTAEIIYEEPATITEEPQEGDAVRNSHIPGLGTGRITKENLENIDALEAYSLESSSSVAIILSWITIALLVALIISNIMQYSFFLDIAKGKFANVYSRASTNDARQAVFEFIAMSGGIISLVAFFIWFYRAHKNLKRANVPGPRHASCWTVWGYFVPIWNFFRPYQMMAETWKGSSAMSGKYNYNELMALSTSARIKWWWATVLIYFSIGFAGSILLNRGTKVEHFLTGTIIGIFAQVVEIIYSILLIYIIKDITAHQSDARKMALVKSTA